MILEKNKIICKQPKIASYVQPQNSNHLRSHLRVIMALDHRRLIRHGKKNQAEFFAFDKFTLQNLANKSGCVKTNFLYHLNITSEVKQFYEGLFLSYRPRAECSISQFCNTECTHSVFRTIDRSTRGLLAKQLKKFQNHLVYMASRFSLLQSELWSCLNEH